MRTIEKIIVHCSASEYGDAALFDQWHRGRGWRGIGYHFVILNGRRAHDHEYVESVDGVIEPGRPVADVGAHCAGHNRESIGVCMVGKHAFTWKQFVALSGLIERLMAAHHLFPVSVSGHCDFTAAKTCPNFDVDQFMIRMA